MGWYYTLGGSRADLIRELTASQHNEETGWARKALKHSAAGNVLWIVWEITASGDGSKRLHIGCDLMGRGPDGSWGHKPFDEDCEPCYYTCPLSYLEMVPETRPEWRAKVRAYWARRKERTQERKSRKTRMMGVASV